MVFCPDAISLKIKKGALIKMTKTIFVGNIPYQVTEEDIFELFKKHGIVTSVKFINDRESGRFKGFGFVVMSHGREAAIQQLNGKFFKGRSLRVNEALQKGHASR